MEGSKHRESKAVSAGTPTALQRPFLVYLEAILPSLSPIERQIGEYILEDPERVLSSTVGDIHLGSGASIGSIVGFCRRLGRLPAFSPPTKPPLLPHPQYSTPPPQHAGRSKHTHDPQGSRRPPKGHSYSEWPRLALCPSRCAANAVAAERCSP